MMTALLCVFLTLVPENGAAQGYPYPTNRPTKLNPQLLGSCFLRQTLSREAFRLNKSDMHCKQIDRVYQGGRYENVNREGLPDAENPFEQYLRAKAFRRCDFESGREARLQNWILSQSDNSITPLAIFKFSIALNDNNIWSALLTIHQVLRNHARWMYPQMYDFNGSMEGTQKLFAKFVDLRGDLVERGENYKGDHAGTWYRIWAGMLLRLSHVNDFEMRSSEFARGRSTNFIPNSWTSFYLRKALASRDKFNLPLSGEPDLRKPEFNLAGLEAASEFMRLITSRNSVLPSEATCESNSYIEPL